MHLLIINVLSPHKIRFFFQGYFKCYMDDIGCILIFRERKYRLSHTYQVFRSENGVGLDTVRPSKVKPSERVSQINDLDRENL